MKTLIFSFLFAGILSLSAAPWTLTTRNAKQKDGIISLSVKQNNRCWMDFQLAGEKFAPRKVLLFDYRLTSSDPASKLVVRFRSGKKWTYNEVGKVSDWTTGKLPFGSIYFESHSGGGKPTAADTFTQMNFYGRNDRKTDMTLELRNIRFAEEGLKFLDPPRTNSDLGRRPAADAVVHTNPPSFVWFQQPDAKSYELEIARNAAVTSGKISKTGLRLNAYCGDKTLAKGVWYWRVRAVLAGGEKTEWSKTTKFEVAPDAEAMCVPPIDEIVKRIPANHPRLYLNPAQVTEFQQRFKGDLKGEYEKMVKLCDFFLAKKTDPWEPQAYVGQRGSPERTKSWRRNYGHANEVSMRMSQLAFGWRMTGDRRYLAEARRLLNGILSWDVNGYSRMRYNDEAGMPILRHLARGYTFLYDDLTPEERAKCIKVMKARGGEAYGMLCPRILYKPFDSHANRMFYFLGEAAIAFHGDLPEAKDWLEFVLTYFYSTYPVWGDEDGNWHEGPHYWRCYMDTFVDWADVLKNNLGLNAFAKPYFKNTGTWLMMSELPGTTGFGWGDFAEMFRDRNAVTAMRVFAVQSGNPYWQWYYNQVAKSGKAPDVASYASLLRAAYPKSAGKAPTGLPTSKCFRGNGITIMNSSLLSARDAVQVQMKCGAQFGTTSHGYESANSFTVNAFGERLLIRSGIRDCYGSRFHRDFMWDTQSQNNLLFDGKGQIKHTMCPMGKILAWKTTPELDRVVGEAAACYPSKLVKRYTREIFFRKPDAILVIDRVATVKPVKIDFLLHALRDFSVKDQHNISVVKDGAACTVDLMWPEKLKVTHTWESDPPIIDPVVLRHGKEYHLRAVPENKLDKACFITLIRPYKQGAAVPAKGTVTKTATGFTVKVPVKNGTWTTDVKL